MTQSALMLFSPTGDALTIFVDTYPRPEVGQEGDPSPRPRTPAPNESPCIALMRELLRSLSGCLMYSKTCPQPSASLGDGMNRLINSRKVHCFEVRLGPSHL